MQENINNVFFRNANSSHIPLVEGQRTEGSRLALVIPLGPALCDPEDDSLPGFSAHRFSREEHWSG